MSDDYIQSMANDLRWRNSNPEYLLSMVRQFVDMEPDAKAAPNQLRELRIFFRALDDHLSGGGNPPATWREGPDAVPARDDDYTPEAMDRTEGGR